MKLTLGELPDTDKQALDATTRAGSHDAERLAQGSRPDRDRAAEDGKGIVVTDVDPDSDAAERGLQAGDVICRVNSQEVSGPDDFDKAHAGCRQGGPQGGARPGGARRRQPLRGAAGRQG